MPFVSSTPTLALPSPSITLEIPPRPSNTRQSSWHPPHPPGLTRSSFSLGSHPATISPPPKIKYLTAMSNLYWILSSLASYVSSSPFQPPSYHPFTQTTTVFAYGVTSSGKTHTMQGTTQSPGVIPRAVEVSYIPRLTCHHF